MKDAHRKFLKRGIFLLLLAALLTACSRTEVSPQPASPFSVEGDKILIQADSPLLGRMEMLETAPAALAAQELRTVGQMIALANASGALSGSMVSWAELDPEVSRSSGIRFSLLTQSSVGEAYGMTSISADYVGKVAVGERIEISRYGLRKSSVAAAVVALRRGGAGEDAVRVVFKIRNGQDWYPGTNCDVTFPMIQSHPVKVPTTALIHEGIREYVVKQTGPGQFSARAVTIVGSTPDSVLVIGAIATGEKIVGRGAILLKPIIAEIAQKRRQSPNQLPGQLSGQVGAEAPVDAAANQGAL